MKEISKVAIVIPMYKKNLSDLEKISLKQVYNVLCNYDIIFVMPERLRGWMDNDYCKVYFPDSFFESIDTYNQLMLSNCFYESFLAYQYILIYQLDAFVFADKLAYFCDLGYDYIGAPWLRGMFNYVDCTHSVWHVGNGGFSLRNVRRCLSLLDLGENISAFPANEDLFFGMGGSAEFKVAPLEVALQFSFESEVRECYQLNNYELPFGCHAWERYDLDFWKGKIESFGFQIDMQLTETGREDVLKKRDYQEEYVKNQFWKEKYTPLMLKHYLETSFKNRTSYLIFGAGRLGKRLGKMLQEAGITYEGYLDNDCRFKGQELEKHKVLDIKKISKGKYNIIIANDKSRYEIAGQLKEMGYRYEEQYIFFQDIIQALMKK